MEVLCTGKAMELVLLLVAGIMWYQMDNPLDRPIEQQLSTLVNVCNKNQWSTVIQSVSQALRKLNKKQQHNRPS